ncbi:MAG: ribosome small subunit-dependent GTPase A [Spirochaetaceae bacterium]|nr:MAG: ribosome small subunit-dependent GTPase A [Spirochaetaceae bacterium]
MNRATITEGVVLSGANNIFQVNAEGKTVQCRIKGKVLWAVESEYNVLAPGDRVRIELSDGAGNEGRIVERGPRDNHLSRWNRKRNAVQALAANVSLVAVVASPVLPPLRPRFVDRMLAAAELGGCELLIVLNKIDQGLPKQWAERITDYRRIGYPVCEVSAQTGVGLDELRARFAGVTVALAGQSGVGKSSLINAMLPGKTARTGDVSEKYSRGRHVTTAGETYRGDGLVIIDTPGIREIDLYPHSAVDIAWGFREFRDADCAYSGCTHLHEPGCGVVEMVESGAVHPDRYDAYCGCVADRDASGRRVGTWSA